MFRKTQIHISNFFVIIRQLIKSIFILKLIIATTFHLPLATVKGRKYVDPNLGR